MTAPSNYDPHAFPPFAVTGDTAVFTRRDGRLMVVMIRRGNDPYQGRWAFPGGFVDIDEDLESAARRELEEETGLTVDDLTQLGAYGTPGRDPRMRVVTVLYVTFATDLPDPVGGDDAAEARIWDVAELLAEPDLLAFDHHQLLSDAVEFIER